MGCLRIIFPFLGEGNDEMNVVTFSLKNLKRRKMRTSLAILGIALGVMLITSLLFIMDGLESSITGSLELLSGNLIIQEKGSVDQTLSIVNVSLIENPRNNTDIKVISPEIYVARTLPGSVGQRFITLIGVTDSYSEIVSPTYIKFGTFFHETDVVR
jgi:putative ABC transport system permease protein